MPIYEYSCSKCEFQFEKLVKDINDPSEVVQCPQCGADKPYKLVSLSAFHLKGDGWYKKSSSS